MTDIVVSVVCMAYNHEKYIRRCLDGFVNQKTDFAFEVIVHDDCSTDTTQSIIREYEARYPQIIKPIYQQENQYSQSVNVNAKFIVPQVRGRYVAICEGDDYWCDPHKLQRQVDAMEANPGCSMSVHKVREVREDEAPTGVEFPRDPVRPGVLTAREFLEIGQRYSFHTSSYFFRAEYFKEYSLDPPAFIWKCDVGDEVYMLFFAQQGDVYYFEETMSCYRRGVNDSWSAKRKKNRTLEALTRHPRMMVDTLLSFDEYSGGRFHDLCVRRIGRQMAILTILEGTAARMFEKENREYMAGLSASRKLFLAFGAVMPKLASRVYLSRLEKLSGE